MARVKLMMRIRMILVSSKFSFGLFENARRDALCAAVEIPHLVIDEAKGPGDPRPFAFRVLRVDGDRQRLIGTVGGRAAVGDMDGERVSASRLRSAADDAG